MNPYLLFEFVNEDGVNTPYLFKEPITIYETNKLSEVASIFPKLETAVEDGYYVAGCISYEAAPAFDSKFNIHSQSQFPLVWFGVFNSPINIEKKATEQAYHVSEWSPDISFEGYQSSINKIKDAIEAGHTYQVNYTTRLHAQFSGDDFSFYQQLSRNQQASYSAYLNIGRYRILSASPELFFRVRNNKITTKPMKGTAKRGRFSKEDYTNIELLKSSKKEHAENLMIVDLLRNDIGRIAKPGSVRVPKLFEIESYPTVHQMTSTIEGELESHTTVFEWFQALFPCGSITGAPKIRTMDYIAKLEKPREVYCGAIGFITPNREAVFNVPIRTVIIDKDQNKASYGVGGGITWDSTAAGEYEELLTKARLLTERRPDFQLLESLALKDGQYPLESYHINRLLDSASYFNFPVTKVEVTNHLDYLAKAYPKGSYKVRMLANQIGEITIEASPIKALSEQVTCKLAKTSINNQDPFLYHKTTHRKMYEEHQAAAPSDTFSILLWNKNGELTEFTIGNLVVEMDGILYTPPIECGLLAGTFRQQLLDQGIIEEKILNKRDLHRFEKIWFINSVRGWLQVSI